MSMRLSNSIVLFLPLLMLSLFSCHHSDETENRKVVKDTSVAKKTVSIKEYSQEFQSLIQTGEGVFRGVDLGLSKDLVLKKESGFGNSQLQEESPDHLDFMIEMGSLENTDLTYLLNDRANVESIEVNIYPNSKSSQDSLFKEFENYFTRLYGSGQELSPGYMKWMKKESDLLIEMQKRDTQKIHDINIIFSYLSRQSAGVLYQPLPEGL